MRSVIDRFEGEYSFLSNFAPSPIHSGGKVWPTAEHLFQAMKTDDEPAREPIRLAATPGKAKRLGSRLRQREDWEAVKRDVMAKVVRLKFAQNQTLARRLIKTGNALLIEGNNWHYNTWGKCSCENCREVGGKNWLGWILMQVREELLGDERPEPGPGRGDGKP